VSGDNLFFRWLGRINALLFFAGASVLLVLAAGELWPSRYVPPLPDHAQKLQDGAVYDFAGSFDSVPGGSSAILRVDGTEEGLMMLQRRMVSYDGTFRSSGPGGLDSNVNVLIFDMRTMRNRWMFKGLKQDIKKPLFVRATASVSNDPHAPVVAILLPVAASDSDGDGKLTYADFHSLYLYRPGSAGPVELIKAEGISSMDQIDADRVLVTYYRDKVDSAAMLSTKDFSILAQAGIAAAPK